MNSSADTCFRRSTNDVLVPTVSVLHREEEYDPAGFDVLRDMQQRHFWYNGRHRFLLHAVQSAVRSFSGDRRDSLNALDLGGGCGGWLAYLLGHDPHLFSQVALADSSLRALEYASGVVGPNVERYQIDVCRLPWTAQWDVVFLLDVLEHIPQDVDVLMQIQKALRPGGYLFVTTPAFNAFWSYNDDLAHHVRRYVRRDFARLAAAARLQLIKTRYFMFFLSPLLVMTRLKRPNIAGMTSEQIQAHQLKTHRVPLRPINSALSFIFGLETPLGYWLPFPWGTSILGVFRKACD